MIKIELNVFNGHFNILKLAIEKDHKINVLKIREQATIRNKCLISD